MAECLRFVRGRLSASTCPSQLQLSTNLNKSARQDVSLSDPAWNAQHGFGPGCSRPSDRTRARSGLFAHDWEFASHRKRTRARKETQGLGRLLDMDRAGRGLETDALVAPWPARCGDRLRLHAGS